MTGGHPQAFTQRPAVPLRPSLWAPPGLVAGAVNAPPQLLGHLGGGAVNLYTAGAQPPRRPRLHPPSLTLGSMKGRLDFSLACVDLSPPLRLPRSRNKLLPHAIHRSVTIRPRSRCFHFISFYLFFSLDLSQKAEKRCLFIFKCFISPAYFKDWLLNMRQGK